MLLKSKLSLHKFVSRVDILQHEALASCYDNSSLTTKLWGLWHKPHPAILCLRKLFSQLLTSTPSFLNEVVTMQRTIFSFFFSFFRCKAVAFYIVPRVNYLHLAQNQLASSEWRSSIGVRKHTGFVFCNNSLSVKNASVVMVIITPLCTHLGMPQISTKPSHLRRMNALQARCHLTVATN